MLSYTCCFPPRRIDDPLPVVIFVAVRRITQAIARTLMHIPAKALPCAVMAISWLLLDLFFRFALVVGCVAVCQPLSQLSLAVTLKKETSETEHMCIEKFQHKITTVYFRICQKKLCFNGNCLK